MVNIMDFCKSLNISIGTVMKNSEMIKFVSDHQQTNKHVSMQLKTYLIYYILTYVPDQYKTQQM